uniref:Transmembrane protein n=1 Tax=Cucumis melo TaxID=3656 RepID=A0A9I9DRH6_CUCME
MNMAQQDPRSGVFHEISSLLLKILRSPPPPVPFSDHVLELSSVISSSSSRILPSSQMTPAGFAALLLGISLALMLCGSVTFFLGFMLMPWILVLVMIFYVVGIVSSLSVLGRSLICCFTAPTPRKDFHVMWLCAKVV